MSASRSLSAIIRDRAFQNTAARTAAVAAPARSTGIARGFHPAHVPAIAIPHIAIAEIAKDIEVTRIERNCVTAPPKARNYVVLRISYRYRRDWYATLGIYMSARSSAREISQASGCILMHPFAARPHPAAGTPHAPAGGNRTQERSMTYNPPPPGYPPYQQPQYAPQPPPRKSRKGWAAIGCLGLVGLVVVIGAIGAAHKSSSSTAVAPLQTIATVAPPAHSAAAVKAPASSAAPAAAKPVLVATFNGSGIQKTAQFTVTANWGISYAFDCTSFGSTGNFQVFTDGGSDFNGVSVNDLAASKSAVTYAYGDAGTHYLEINSECSWSVKVYSEG